MKKFQKILAKFLLALMILESFGLGNMEIYAQELQDAGEQSTTEVVVTSADASQEVENEDQQNNEVAEEKAEIVQDSENMEGAAGSVGAPQDMNGTITNMETATRAAGESRVMSTSNTSDSRVVENVRITMDAKNDDGSEKLEYLTGEPIKLFAGFTISDTNSEMRNTKLRVKIPKENVNIQTFGSFDNQTTNAVRADTDTHYVAVWTFDRVIGGQIGDVPLLFNMIQPQTPDGFVVPVTLEFLDENNAVLKTTNTEVVGKVDMVAKPFKGIANISGSHINYLCSYYDITTKESPCIRSITGLQEDEMTHTKKGADAPYVDYYIGIQVHLNNVQYGRYRYQNVRIIEKLPEGAVMFGEINDDGYYVYRRNSIDFKWRYNSDSHTAIYEWSLQDYGGSYGKYYDAVYLKLSFPNQSYETIHKNSAIVTIDPNTDKEQVLDEVSAYHKWNPVKASAGGRSGANKSVSSSHSFFRQWATAPVVNWFFNVGNSENNNVNGGLTTKVKEIADYDLDSRLFYKSLRPNHSQTIGLLESVGYNIYGLKKDDTEELIADKFPEDNILLIDDTAQKYKAIIIRFDEELELKNQYVYFQITTELRDDVWKAWKNANGNYADLPEWFRFADAFVDRMINRLDVQWRTNQEDELKKATYGAVTNFYDRNAEISSHNTNRIDVLYSNDNQRDIRNYIRQNAIEETKDLYKNIKYISVLPLGVEFVENSIKAASSVYQAPNNYTIVDNWNNTGRQAVIFDFDELSIGKIVYFDYKVDVTLHTKEWESEIEHFIIYDNENIIGLNGRLGWVSFTDKVPYTDALDLDNDGDITEAFLHGTTTINFTPPRQIILKKLASIDGNNWFFDTPLADMGTDGFFKISIFNNSITDRNGNLTILDALPYIGDHKIVPEEDGSFLPRESTFSVNISESLESNPANAEVLKKWSVFYTTDAQAGSLASVRDANYITADQITDFTKVKSIKLVLNGNLAAGETNDFILKTHIPKNANLERNSKIVNSTAFSYNNVEFAEGNFASITVMHYKISGKIFTDTDKDGNNTDVDLPLSGYVLTLVDKDGNVVLGEDNQPITTISQADGSYEFTVFNRGDYGVKITKKSPNEEITQKFAELGTTGNDAEQDGVTPKFSLNPENLEAVRNFGFIINRGSITLVKKNPEGENLANVIFRLEKDGQTIGTSQATNAEGKIIWSDLELGEYSLIEESTLPAYRLDTTPIAVTIDVNNPNITKEIINQRANWKMKIIKKNPQWERLEGAEFELREGSASGRLIRAGRTDANGELSFDNVIYGNYVLVEKTAPDGYIKGENIAIWENIFTKNSTEIVQEVINEKQLWKIKILKVDSYDKKPLSGAVFALKDESGKEISQKTSNSQGEIIFENIVYWNYTISEINPPAGYSGKVEIKVTTENFKKNIDTLQFTAENTKIPVTGPGGGCIGSCGTPVITTTPPPPVITATPPPSPETPKTPFTMTFTDIVEKWETEIKKFPKRMPRTGQMLDENIYKKAGIVGQKLRKQLETSLRTEDFRLAGYTETSLDFWKQVLPEEDKNANKYIVIPSSGLVMPINSVEKDSRAYNNFINGKNEDFAKYLETGAVDLTGTSTRGFGEGGNKVLGGHSSYWKHSSGRYKTHFQKIISMTEGQEIWIYEKNSDNAFVRYAYRTTSSYNTAEKDVSVLKPTDHAALTLFTCTPVGGVTGRWVVKSEFIGKFSAE